MEYTGNKTKTCVSKLCTSGLAAYILIKNVQEAKISLILTYNLTNLQSQKLACNFPEWNKVNSCICFHNSTNCKTPVQMGIYVIISLLLQKIAWLREGFFCCTNLSKSKSLRLTTIYDDRELCFRSMEISMQRHDCLDLDCGFEEKQN